VIGVVLVGCATTAQKTGYLQSYDKLSKGKYLKNFWANNSYITKKEIKNINVEEINIDRIADQKGVKAEECKKWMQSALLKAVSSFDNRFPFSSPSSKAQWKLEIAITMISPGSAGGRMFAGELGMGHAWVQVEGRIFDVGQNEEVIAFSDFRRSSGVIGLRDIGGDAGPSLVREMLEEIASDIVKEFSGVFDF
jgi:hypothetical protein